MKKIVSFLTLIILLTNCSVPYDGETRYIFETTVLDSDNNPIPNVQCNAIFYNLYSSKNKGPIFPIGSDGGDLIVSSVTDNNGSVRLIFPFAIKRDRVRIAIENDNNSFGQSWYEFINIQKSDFIDYKITESAIKIYRANEIVSLSVQVTNSSLNKYVSKIELIGIKRNAFKDFNISASGPEVIQIFNESYEVIKNQTVILKYEVTNFVPNGQNTTTPFEEQITILSENINYEIIL
jgi:hypothetical protein